MYIYITDLLNDQKTKYLQIKCVWYIYLGAITSILVGRYNNIH